jgi:hypothetical protein
MSLTRASAAVIKTEEIVGTRNRIINGAMEIDQRNAGASSIPVDTYTLDRWEVREDTDGAVTCQRDTDAPSGFKNSLKITVTSTDSSLTGTQRLFVRQPIEGNNVADLGWGTANAKTVTLSFWVKSSVTGTFAGALGNNGNARNYVFTYSINSANTWEYKTVTITGDTSGTWLTDTGMGVGLFFALAMGPDYSTSTVNSWKTGVSFSATGATSLIATSGATWQVTGVQFELGSTATLFERRPFGVELTLCQRYYYRLTPVGSGLELIPGLNPGTTSNLTKVPLPVTMRTSPGIEISSAGWGFVRNRGSFTAYTTTGVSARDGSQPTFAYFDSVVASGLTGAEIGYAAINDGSWLAFSAEF